MQIECFPRHFFHEMDALHRHPCIPEKQYVETGNQHVIGVMTVQCIAFIRPTQSSKGPKRRREPCVENVRVTRQFDASARKCLRGLFGFGDIACAVGGKPRRYLVPPPKLAADAPWLDIFHPVEIGFFPRLRHDVEAAIGLAFARGVDGWFGQCFGIHIPLVGQPWLNHLVRPVAKGRLDDAVFDFFEKAQGVHRLNHHLARIGWLAFNAKAILPDIFCGN